MLDFFLGFGTPKTYLQVYRQINKFPMCQIQCSQTLVVSLKTHELS